MITDLNLIESINKRLHEDYRVLDGRPIYRIVWSDDQLEVRDAVWKEYCGKIFIREYRAIKQIKKYWYMNPPRWVLEKLVFMSRESKLAEIVKELPEAENGTYEPVYTFCDKHDQPLPVSVHVVDVVLWHLHTPLRRSPSDLGAEKLAQENEEVKYFEEQMGRGERSPLFVWEESAFVSTNQLAFRETYKEKIDAPVPGYEHDSLSSTADAE